MITKFVLMCSLLFLAFDITAQKNITLTCIHTFNKKELKLNENRMTTNGDSISIVTLKYYISSIQLLQNKIIVWQQKNSFHLIDEELQQSKHLSLSKIPSTINFDEIQFNMGIDSNTNATGVHGNDLDPTNGMYWTWQNGYINFKLEGNSYTCNTRDHQFHFHIGGYQYPFSTLQTITLPIKKSNEIKLVLDVGTLLSQINLTKDNNIMMPSKVAVDIANTFSTMMYIQE